MKGFQVPTSAKRRAFVVVDLGFGDAGKGLLTDYLVRRHEARMVVRFNGGAQAGHNVVTADGRHHTFAQIGSGSFVPGVRTHLAQPVVVHPTGLLVEAGYLARQGVGGVLQRISVHEACPVVTPFQQAACRVRELARGRNRHGSCGVGVGEVQADAALSKEHVVTVREFGDPPRLRVKLRRLREMKREQLAAAFAEAADHSTAAARALLAPERAAFDDDAVGDRFLAALRPFNDGVAVVDGDAERRLLRDDGAIVWEGAQGLLLDEWRGFHPHTTYSTCLPSAATDLLSSAGYDGDITRIGVHRSYQVRHGDGPLPTEGTVPDGVGVDPHNPDGPWQGPFRAGALDFVLLRYAREIAAGVDALAITHMDALMGRASWPICQSYVLAPGSSTPLIEDLVIGDGPRRSRIVPGVLGDLAHQSAITATLFEARPELCAITAKGGGSDRSGGLVDQLVSRFEAELGAPVALVSHGPRATDVREIKPR